MHADAIDILLSRNAGLPNGVADLWSRSGRLRKLSKLSCSNGTDMGDMIRRAARGRNCTLRLPGCRNDTETTVFAHAPSIDNGMGLKQARDFWGAFACSHCHDVADGRVSTSDQRILILERWLRGVYETQKQLIEDGLIQYNDR